MAALFVTDVEGLAAGVADGVVGPGGQTELVGVLAPGAGQTALRDDGPELRVRQDVHPRRRRGLPGRGRDHVLAPIRGESSQPVEEDQIPARRLRRRRGGGAAELASA